MEVVKPEQEYDIEDNKMGRNFSGSQRTTLFIEGDGHCAICGKPLEPGFHADHIVPFAVGGKTAIENGQPLCRECNLTKGDKSLPGWKKELRAWQQAAWDAYHQKDLEDFLMVAFPGAGKTVASLRILHDLMIRGKIDTTIIVAPSIHLKTQWKLAASEVGIQLNDQYQPNNPLANDMHGFATTYQALCSEDMISMIRYYCLKRKVFAIFDEVHHAGDDNGQPWGASLKLAFKDAKRRLLLSGTPWRTNRESIPFVQYDDRNSCIAHYTYTYTDALTDRVVREISFHAFDGIVRWYHDDDLIEASFYNRNLDETEQRKRLSLALNDESFITKLIEEAWQQLKEYQNEDPSCAMLVVTKDINHSKLVSKIITKITKEMPVCVSSDDQEAHLKIRGFEESNEDILVAVKMVSEGIDIKRLRVLVYLTSTATELFFRQVCGRIVRRRNTNDFIASVFMPADPLLLDWARQIKEERDHFLKQYYDWLMQDLGSNRQKSSVVIPLGVQDAQQGDGVYRAEDVPVEYIVQAKEFMEQTGIHHDPLPIAQWLQKNDLNSHPVTTQETSIPSLPRQDIKAELKQQLDQLERQIAMAMTVKAFGEYNTPDGKKAYVEFKKNISHKINVKFGFAKNERPRATVNQLREMFRYAIELKAENERDTGG